MNISQRMNFKDAPRRRGKRMGGSTTHGAFPHRKKMDFPLLKTNMEVRGGGPLSGIARDTPDPAERIKNPNHLSFFRKETKL